MAKKKALTLKKKPGSSQGVSKPLVYGPVANPSKKKVNPEGKKNWCGSKEGPGQVNKSDYEKYFAPGAKG